MSPGPNVFSSSASATATRSSTVSDDRIGTELRKTRCCDLASSATFLVSSLKDLRSSIHTMASLVAITDAVRGDSNISEISPKMSPAAFELTLTSAPLRLQNTSKVPECTRYISDPMSPSWIMRSFAGTSSTVISLATASRTVSASWWKTTVFSRADLMKSTSSSFALRPAGVSGLADAPPAGRTWSRSVMPCARSWGTCSWSRSLLTLMTRCAGALLVLVAFDGLSRPLDPPGESGLARTSGLSFLSFLSFGSDAPLSSYASP